MLGRRVAGRWALLAAWALVALLVGCAGSEPADEAPLLPAVLDYHLPAEPATLDPTRATGAATLDVVSQLFEGLTRLDPVSSEARPALAEAWDVSGDALTYTFKLRDDVLWIAPDGEPIRPVSAADVAFSIKRLCAPRIDAPLRHVLFVIKGCLEVSQSQGVPDLDRVAVRAIDEFTVEFTLRRPAAYFPTVMSLPVARPIYREGIERNPEGWSTPERLVTNGPYRLDEWSRGERLTLELNRFHPDAARIAIVTVHAWVIPDPAEALRRFHDHALDLVTLDPLVEPPVLDGDARLHEVPEPCSVALAFTTVKSPVNSARVRLALSLAIDRVALREVSSASPLVADFFAPPEVFGAPTSGGMAYDPQRARALLAAAGYAGGEGFPPLRLLYPSGPFAPVARDIARMWEEELAIVTERGEEPLDTYRRTIRATTPLEEAPHVWLLNWCADLPDEHDWITTIFNVSLPHDPTGDASRARAIELTVAPGGNAARRVPGRLDRLTTEAEIERDPDARRALYEEAERLLVLEEAVIAPLFHPTRRLLTQPWLDGRLLSGVGQPLATWSLDTERKLATRDPPAGTTP